MRVRPEYKPRQSGPKAELLNPKLLPSQPGDGAVSQCALRSIPAPCPSRRTPGLSVSLHMAQPSLREVICFLALSASVPRSLACCLWPISVESGHLPVQTVHLRQAWPETSPAPDPEWAQGRTP